ncbi:hypothetical protein Franean1_6745 [Parafrankia sp. EAN1pec]|uniref:hypothetical protein n=1 Tax=Parafrankia sp. (strain EAN1pec) TaxID=298653 RepID=UPI0000540469|nr:hypothetical protein Franean1_6745 [Frankia sp. EAN1pec]
MSMPPIRPPFDFPAFLKERGFSRLRERPDVYLNDRVEIEHDGGQLHLRCYTTSARRLIDWSCTYGPGTPTELIVSGVLAALTPVPVARADAGEYTVWAAVPIPFAVELSHDTAHAATQRLRAWGWPYATIGPARSAPPTGAPAPQSDTP